MSLLFEILTLFPEPVMAYLDCSIMGRARAAGLIRVEVTDIRTFAHDRHRTVDDRPFGGGAGMVMKPEPLAEAIEAAKPGRVILTSPRGRPFDQAAALRLLELAEPGEEGGQKIILVCGRYEGVDQRIIDSLIDEEISLGDFILTGGELAALAVVDAVARLKPGVLGEESSTEEESFTQGLLEYPHYTRPRVFKGLEAPAILLSGDHAKVAAWRQEQALKATRWRRPELLEALKAKKAEGD